MNLDYQLTEWVNDIREVRFAINQLDKHEGKQWEIKQKGKSLAVFTTPPTKQMLITSKPEVLNESSSRVLGMSRVI